MILISESPLILLRLPIFNIYFPLSAVNLFLWGPQGWSGVVEAHDWLELVVSWNGIQGISRGR